MRAIIRGVSLSIVARFPYYLRAVLHCNARIRWSASAAAEEILANINNLPTDTVGVVVLHDNIRVHFQAFY